MLLVLETSKDTPLSTQALTDLEEPEDMFDYHRKKNYSRGHMADLCVVRLFHLAARAGRKNRGRVGSIPDWPSIIILC